MSVESILTSIKKLLGPSEEDTSFDDDITMFINSAIMRLSQLGVCDAGFRIQDKSSVWSDLLGGRTDLESVKTYIFIKVKLVFDPPATGPLIEALKNQANDLEFLINYQVEAET